MCRKSKQRSTEKRPKGELNHHNKGAEDEERGQLPSLKKKDYSQALLGPRKKQRADVLRTAGSDDKTESGHESAAS